MIFSVDEIFKFLNLLLRIGLVIYLVKRYAVGSIMKYIGQEKTAIDLLQQQRIQLRQECEQVEQTMKDEEKIFQAMQEKFAAWDKSVNAAAFQEQAMCKERQKKMNLLANRKLESIKRRHLMQEEIPALIEQATKDLQQAFQEDKARGQKYITKVLDALGE
ncbi:MAG: hypothetical protein WC747_01130 [Candidatus Babeliales bacterium]|jgi:hypothetical protein